MNNDSSKPYKSNKNQDNMAEQWLKNNVKEILDFEETPLLEDLLTHLKAFVELKGGSITTSQLRNIYARVRTCTTRRQLQLLRPRLVFLAARQNTPDAKSIVESFEEIMTKVSDDQVKNFKAYFEAFVAYHKYYHGKK